MSLTEFAADSGTAIADSSAPAATEYADLALDLIVESPTNPRTVFDEAALKDLAESIAAVDVLQPVLVRPLPADRLQETHQKRRKGAPLPTHELVSGARRYRGSRMAGKATIPAVIKALTDAQVAKIQLVENLQREDLSPLEEAEGYHQLIERTGLAKETIGDEIGKSRSYVYQRLKLLDLSEEGREAMRTGKLDFSRALLIARIPDQKLQKKALAEATREDYNGELAMSLRGLQRWLQDNVMLRLDRASFDIKDESLHATAGACKACPKRTGADPENFADVDSADICTDPKCYEAKSSVHRDRLIAKAESKGMTVIEGKAAKEIVRQYSSSLEGYSRLDQKRHDVDESGPTLRKLLGKDAPSPVLIENPYTKELIEAVPTAEAEAVLIAKGEIKASQTSSGQDLDAKIDSARQHDEHHGPKGVRKAMFAAVQDAVRTTPDEQTHALVTVEALRAWLIRMVVNYDAGDDMVMALNLTVEGDGYRDNEQAVVNALQAASDANVWRAFALFMAVDEADWFSYGNRDQSPTVMVAIAKATDLDLDAVQVKAQADRKAQLREKIAELKAKHAPKKAVDAEKSSAKAKGKKSIAPPAAQAKRAKKVTAKEAQAAIAEQLQALDGAEAGATEDQDQAPDGAGNEGAAPAAPAPSPHSFWPFPTKGLQEETPAFGNGAIVRVKVDSRGPNGKVRKTAGKVGRVESTISGDGDRIGVRFGPKAHELVVLSTVDLETYIADPVVGCRVRVVSSGFLAQERNRLTWRAGEVKGLGSNGWKVLLDGEESPMEFGTDELEVLA